ncbi:MAG: hypothetical protein F4118_08070 [Acidimicrobiaceae bacterium]|nr:hypothetical protein [Acidimicrobiaceae bacterium]
MPKDDIEGRDRKFVRLGTKGDPLNIDSDAFEKDGRKPSEVGHGQVPFGGPGRNDVEEKKRRPPAMSFARITQTADLSFATLRRVADRRNHPPGFAPAQARALLALLALWAHARRFGNPADLRTGTTLRILPGTLKVQAVTSSGLDDCSLPLTGDAVTEQSIAKMVEELDLPAGLDGWGQEPVVLRPDKTLSGRIVQTWPVPGGDS